MPTTSVPLVILGLVLAAGSGIVASLETATLLRGSDYASERVLQIPPGQNSIGWSEDSAFVALRDCMILRQPQSLEMRYAGEDGRRQIVETCVNQADAVLHRFPASGYAFFVRAASNLAGGNTDEFNRDFVYSQAVSSSEQWLAELRIALAEDSFNKLSAEAIAAEAADIRLLLISRKGLRSLSMRYVRMPAFRERIAAIAETMPAEVQNRLLKNLQWTLR